MNGKEYVQAALDAGDKLIAEIKESGSIKNDELLNEFENAVQKLDQVKNKATLRTKSGTNRAFPVYDIMERLKEIWEDNRGTEELDEVEESIQEFISNVDSLSAALKERTVIMT